MKNFKFINQSLWAGSSPNQTGETLTRQNRIGGKSWLNRGLMLLITILTLGVGQMWADEPYIEGFGLQFREGSSTLYTKTSTKGDGGIQDLDLGVKSDLKIVYIYANGNKNGGNLCTDQNYFKYEIYGPTGTAHWDGMNREFIGDWYGSYSEKITYKWGYENGTSAISDPSGSFELTEGRTPGEYNMQFYFSFEGNSSSSGCGSWYDCKYSGSNWKFSWTIPGFSGAPASKAFGTIPVDKEAETTISFNHYGNALEAEDFVITGSSDFTVRSFSESDVNVVFSPTTTGNKSATLTITDDYDNTCTISLTGTAASAGTVGTVTTLYFNDYQYDGAGDWAALSAGYRFVCAYTDGVYTHYNMTKCPNTEHTYTAQVEIVAEKSISIDRYNPSTYAMWNSATPSNPGLSSTNPYAKSKDINGAYATNHPYNDVGNRRFYYDNSASGFTNTLCLLIGRDKRVSDDASNTYSKAYTMSPVTNTKLYYCAETAGTDTWHDVTYYAVIGTSSDASTISGWSSSNNWGSSTISTKGNKGYTAAYTSLFGLIDGNVYLASASSYSGGAMTINKCASTTSSFNSTQTIKYALSTDGGDSYSDMSSGNTPGQISISAYKFVDGTYNSVTNTSNTATISSNTSGTYSTSVPAAYTGETTLSASARLGYSFDSWDAASTTLYPKTAATYTARFIAHRYTINFNVNDAQYDGTTSYGSMDPMTNVVYDQSTTLPSNGFHRIGYKFDGWATTPSGPVTYTDKATAILNLTTTDGASATLYAKWSTDVNTFTNADGDGVWGNEANWSEGNVPENDDATITINQPVTISGGSYHIGELSFGASGSLTIAADGALEVAGTITNNDASKIVINSTTTNQGALIFNSTGSTAATVEMTLNAASDKFQFIAIPVPYINVADKFHGSTVYTYGWSNTKHEWERRGYYDGFSSFEAVLVKGQGSASFSGNLVATGNRTYSGTYSADNYGYVYMYGNSWTAPITMSAEGFDNASIGIMKGSTNGWDGVVEGDVIPALQAFGVAVNSGGGSITINYDRDVRNPSNPNAPLKAPQRLTSEVQEPITVYVSGNEMQTRIRLFEDATRFSDEFDNGWEALYMEGYGYAGEMYAMGTDKMNVLATNNLEGTVVGFVPGQAENYTISFAGDGKGYYLNDIKMEEATLIDEGNTYEFTSDEKTNSARFVISKTPIAKTPTSVDNINDGVKARKQMINGALYIIRDGRIYNAEGNLVK